MRDFATDSAPLRDRFPDVPRPVAALAMDYPAGHVIPEHQHRRGFHFLKFNPDYKNSVSRFWKDENGKNGFLKQEMEVRKNSPPRRSFYMSVVGKDGKIMTEKEYFGKYIKKRTVRI